jgi:hypothetical protein
MRLISVTGPSAPNRTRKPGAKLGAKLSLLAIQRRFLSERVGQKSLFCCVLSMSRHLAQVPDVDGGRLIHGCIKVP